MTIWVDEDVCPIVIKDILYRNLKNLIKFLRFIHFYKITSLVFLCKLLFIFMYCTSLMISNPVYVQSLGKHLL